MLIASLLAIVAASTGPVHLRCTFPSAPVAVLIAADEANGTVRLTIPSTGYAERLSAASNAEQLSFNNGVIGVAVDRVDLSAIRIQRLGGGAVKGACKIEEPPNRAF
jgi:hypothetical protein